MIPVARYRLTFTVESPLSLPAFAGSTLRGAFGHALRRDSCLTGALECTGCSLLSRCPYARIFEPRPAQANHPLQDFNQIPRPYVIEPPGWGEKHYLPGERLSFHLVLAGEMPDMLDLSLNAFHRALQAGVGPGLGRARLENTHLITPEGPQLIQEGPGRPIAPHIRMLPPPSHANARTAALLFHAPLRLQTNGRRARAEELTSRKLLTTLIRRIALMCEFHGNGPLPLDFAGLARQADTLESHKTLQWRDWARFSSRQQQKMDLGGVVGNWTLRGDLAAFIPFLHLGQWLHLGKETVFGLGGYRLELHP